TRTWTFDLELAHVRDVEDAAFCPHRLVLGNHAFVLDGHLPAREGNHARPEGDVTVVKRRPQKGLHPGGDAKGSRPGPPAKARGPGRPDRVIAGFPLSEEPERATANVPQPARF